MGEKKFKEGDIVLLKSGSPKMTVMGYEPKDGLNVNCTWFDKSEVKEKSFNENLLQNYKPSDLGIRVGKTRNKYRF